jgi:hypothetical protein
MKHIEETLGGIALALTIIAVIGIIFFLSSYKVSCNTKYVDNGLKDNSYSLLVCAWSEK